MGTNRGSAEGSTINETYELEIEMGVTKIAAGFAVGYILGTRAGRDTYERIVDGTRTLANQPAAQRVLATGHDAATTVATTAAAKADDVTTTDVGSIADVDHSTRSV